MVGSLLGYFWIVATVALTVYGQLVFKWRAEKAEAFPAELGERLEYVARLAVDPWIVSVFASALLASVTWWAALREFDLSFAYPFMSLSFVAVLVLSVWLFSEELTVAKVAGLALIVGGLVVASQG